MGAYQLRIVFLGIFIHLFSFASAKEPHFQYYVINISNGLNTNNINDCIKDRRGFLWMATDFGLTRYAGQQSIHFSTDPSTGKPFGHFLKLLVTDSVIYAAGTEGLYAIDPLHCGIRKLNLHNNEVILDMVFYKDQLIVGTKDGKIIFYQPKTQKIETVALAERTILNLLVKNNLLFCLNLHFGSVVLDLQTKKVVSTEMLRPYYYTDKLYLSHEGEVLMSNRGFLKKFNEQTWRFEATSDLKNTTGYKELADKSIFFITDFHQLNFRDKEKRVYTLSPPIDKSTEYKKIKGDLNGDIYVISNQGVLIIRKVVPFTVMNVFGDDHVHVQRAIYEDTIHKRLLFFSYDKLGIYDQKQKKWGVKSLPASTHTVIENGNDLLLVTEGSTLQKLDLKQLKNTLLFINERPALQFISVARTFDGTLLLGSLDGLFKTKDPTKGIEHIPLIHKGVDYSKMQVKALWVNADKIWVGGNSGIFVLDKSFNIVEQYASSATGNRYLPVNEVNCFFAVKNGLYVGLDGELAFVPFNGAAPVLYYSPIYGKSNNRIVTILEDSFQDIWFSSYKGVFRLTPQSGAIRSFHAPIYFSNDEFNRSSSLKARNGKLYFGNISEYVEIDPANYLDTTKTSSFQFNLCRIFSNGQKELIRYDVNNGDTVRLPLEGASIDISYRLHDPINYGQHSYQYRLVGINNDWLDLGNRTSLQLFSLPAGTYKLEIMAIGDDGFVSKPLVMNIEVPAIFYKTVWFISLAILFMLGLGGIFYWIRVRNLRRLLKFRKEISNELHDSVGTTVTKSIYMAESLLRESEHQDKRLQQIIDYGRQINANFRDVLWSLERKTDPIVNLFDRINEIGQQAVSHTPFDFQMIKEHVDENFPLQIRQKRDLLMISREAIHNALKHSNGQFITFHFFIQQQKLHLKITDNGKHSDTTIHSTGMGLESMRLRAQKMGAVISFTKREDGFEVYLII